MENIISSEGVVHTEAGDLDLNDWTSKVERRTKNRMKITFKLNQEQAAAYEHFKNQTKPEEISETQFITSIFFMGLAALEAQIIAKAQEAIESEDVDLDAILEDAVESVEPEIVADEGSE